MSGNFASGKIAFGFCDRCGFRCKLTAMRKNVINTKLTDIKTCPSCWDPDQPQYRIGMVDTKDPQALREPRPDISLADSR